MFHDTESMENPADLTQCQANQDIQCSRKYTQFFSREFFKVWKWNRGYLDHVDYFDIPVGTGSYCESLLGTGKRSKRSIGLEFHDKLRDDTFTTLYRVDGTWTPRDPAMETTSKPNPNTGAYNAPPTALWILTIMLLFFLLICDI